MLPAMALVLWPMLVMVGCAANQQSRQLASQLRQVTAEYNAATTRKLQAEQNFYLESGKNLGSTLNVVDPTKQSGDADVKYTLAYGRIITTTNSESLKLAADLINDAGSAGAAAKITTFLQDGVRSEDQAFREARAQQAQAAAAMAAALAAIEQYQATLTGMVRQLSELENPQSFSANASQVEAIGKAVIDQIRKGQTPKK